MTKYIDLACEITRMRDSADGREGVYRALYWLDNHPDLVPRRTITKTEFDEAFNSTVGLTTPAVCIEMLSMQGIDVVADPEPNNTDRLEQLLRESGFEFFTSGYAADARELAEWLNSDCVKAPGFYDE